MKHLRKFSFSKSQSLTQWLPAKYFTKALGASFSCYVSAEHWWQKTEKTQLSCINLNSYFFSHIIQIYIKAKHNWGTKRSKNRSGIHFGTYINLSNFCHKTYFRVTASKCIRKIQKVKQLVKAKPFLSTRKGPNSIVILSSENKIAWSNQKQIYCIVLMNAL